MRDPARLVALAVAGVAVATGLVIGIDGWPGAEPAILNGFPDCEAPGGGVVAQPTAAWSSLIFVAIGIWIAGDRRLVPPPSRLLFALAIGAVGLASFFGHAALTGWARQLDSLAIKLLLVTFLVASAGRLRAWPGPVVYAAWAGMAGLTVGLELTWPAVGEPVLATLVVAAVALAAAATAPELRGRLVTGLLLLAAAGAAWWLGGGDGPLCAPESWFQLHGLWHILAAGGITAVYQIYRSEAT